MTIGIAKCSGTFIIFDVSIATSGIATLVSSLPLSSTSVGAPALYLPSNNCVYSGFAPSTICNLLSFVLFVPTFPSRISATSSALST